MNLDQTLNWLSVCMKCGVNLWETIQIQQRKTETMFKNKGYWRKDTDICIQTDDDSDTDITFK